MRVHILYHNYLTADGSKMSIGGIQTYISELAPVFRDLGYAVSIYQGAEVEFRKEVNDCEVVGCICTNPRKKRQVLLNKCMEHFDADSDILLWATETLTTKVPGNIKSIAIQHGVSWDKPEQCGSKFKSFLRCCMKAVDAIRTIRHTALASKLICVDYNYVNWYRSLVAEQEVSLEVIPNFSVIAPKRGNAQSEDGPVKIIFARRFFPYRGTRIFGNAMKRMLDANYPVEVTVAGEGPDEQWLRDMLGGYPNVQFIKYGSEESLAVHGDKDIAVVPTTGSEGTSLSLLEAMSAQCAVICTNVGGMTNIILDHYNGLMINPDEEALYRAMLTLIEDRQLRRKLADKGYETVREGFSREIWRERWKGIIQELSSTNL